MNQNTPATLPVKKASIIEAMAAHYGMDPDKFYSTITATVMPKGTSNEQVAAFMIVAHKYTLDPFTKEIYAFSGQGGAVVPIVGIDGWMALANRQPMFDGIEFEYNASADGKLESVTAIVHRKDRSHPVKVTEYMAECKRNTGPWNQSPNRMLRHRAAAQGIRYAFGIGGIYVSPDDAEVGDYEIMPEANAEVVNTETGEITEQPAQAEKPAPTKKDPFA